MRSLKLEKWYFENLEKYIHLFRKSKNLKKEIYATNFKRKKELKSDNLPIFSRISLQRVMNDLKLMKIKVKVVFIKDRVDRKKTI